MKKYNWRKLKAVTSTKLAIATLVAGALSLSGCYSPKALERPIKPISGPPIQDSHTYYSKSLACLGKVINETHKDDKIVLSVDAIPDQTGKFNYEEEGYVVTQGAETMVISAIGKTDAFTLVERTHLDIPLFELEYARDFVLSDANASENYVDEQGKLARAIYSGAMKGSDYVVVGNISEVNFNLGSGGFEVFIDGIGGGWRTFWLDVAIDLRVIDVNSTEIIMTLPLRKQIVGYENKVGVTRFFGDTFVNGSIGSLAVEPIQIAVRAILEGAVGDIARDLYDLPANTCLPGQEYRTRTTDTMPPSGLGKGKSYETMSDTTTDDYTAVTDDNHVSIEDDSAIADTFETEAIQFDPSDSAANDDTFITNVEDISYDDSFITSASESPSDIDDPMIADPLADSDNTITEISSDIQTQDNDESIF